MRTAPQARLNSEASGVLERCYSLPQMQLVELSNFVVVHIVAFLEGMEGTLPTVGIVEARAMPLPTITSITIHSSPTLPKSEQCLRYAGNLEKASPDKACCCIVLQFKSAEIVSALEGELTCKYSDRPPSRQTEDICDFVSACFKTTRRPNGHRLDATHDEGCSYLRSATMHCMQLCEWDSRHPGFHVCCFRNTCCTHESCLVPRAM
ncbi:hypothetical protein WJX77_010750 [Trebouxia sp. C0004]